MQQCINAKIHQEVTKEQKGPEEFYNLLAKREERHFRIDQDHPVFVRYLINLSSTQRRKKIKIIVFFAPWRLCAVMSS